MCDGRNMTRVPAHSPDPDRHLHQIDGTVSVLVRLMARQAAKDACQDSDPKDTHNDPSQPEDR